MSCVGTGMTLALVFLASEPLEGHRTLKLSEFFLRNPERAGVTIPDRNVARGRGPCEECGSANVSLIRTSRCDIEIKVRGVTIRFVRLYLERCQDCHRITLSGKTCLGPFSKTYIPADEAFGRGPTASG